MNQSERVELLKRVPLFADLERRDLEMIAQSLKERTFRPGETIATEGERGVGDYLGEIALTAETDRTATVTAETELRCLGMTFWDFRPLVETNGKIAWKLLQSLAKQMQGR